MMQQPSLKPRPTLDSLGIARKPVYLRKLKKRTAWDPQDISGNASRVFPKQTNSLFLVANEEDLYKVAAALNSGKSTHDGMNDGGSFIWITTDELEVCGIPLHPERDEQQIKCPAAQKLHKNAAGEEAVWLRLCKLLAQGNRLVPITEGQMKSMNQWLRPQGCWSYTENRIRKCDLCPSETAGL